MDEDQRYDAQVKEFLEDLKKVGPNAKQILNYSYPPLLYQRGDDDDDEEEEEEEGDDDDHGLPDLGPDFDEDEDQDIQELINGQAAATGDGEILKGLDQASKARDGKIYYE